MPDADGAECRHAAPTPDYLEDILSRYPTAPVYWIAYSGGLDSTVLLHLCAALQERRAQRTFKAIHVHHGLQAEADAWANHCEQTCRRLGIGLRIQHADARPAPGDSPEASARSARYRVIRRCLEPGATVLMAQHQDDQAETLLLQLFRGAGLAGLAAMPVHAELAPGYLLRPLLDLPRTALRQYAGEHGLSWVEDPSNQNPKLERNFLRHAILPALLTHWPGIARTLARSARHCAEAHELLNARARELLGAVCGAEPHALDIPRLRSLGAGERRLVLRIWLKTCGYRTPPAAILERILAEGLNAGADRNPRVRWPEGEVRRYRDTLYLLPPLPAVASGMTHDWPSAATRCKLPDGHGELQLKAMPGGGIALDCWRAARCSIRYRQGGEKIRLPGRAGSHELRKLFQEAGIPPWIRERVPLIYLDAQLAAVGGFWVAAEVWTPAGLAPVWQAPPGLTLARPHPGMAATLADQQR